MPGTQPIKNKNDLVHFFDDAAVPSHELMMGIEVERSGVFDKDLSPVPYLGSKGYLAILRKLNQEMGWEIMQEENGNIVSLRRGESYLHIEDDGRIELASKPRLRLKNLVREFHMYDREIREISKIFGVRWISTGWQPFAKTKDIQWCPRKRGESLRNLIFSKNKKYGEQWLKKTNSVHVNFGFTSEEDAIQKFQTIYKVSPILIAMFANSALNAKKFSGYMENRFRVSQFEPKRTHIQKAFLEEDFNFEKWIDFLLNTEMMSIDRGGKDIFLNQKTFGDFLKNGHGKIKPQMKDFTLHLKSIWNECRIKNYLEYRGIDCVPPHLIESIPALIRGITLDADTMEAVQNLTKGWTFEDHQKVRDNVCKNALQAEIPDGGKILTLAKELLEIANIALKNAQKKWQLRHDNTRLLWPIKEYVFVREQSPAEFTMEMWNGEWRKDPYKLLEWSES